MKTTTLFSIQALCVAVALAAPIDNYEYVVHESRAATTTGHHRRDLNWKRGDRLHRDAIIPLRIALTQSNLDRGQQELMRVADPLSPDFGQHLSQQQVHDLFAPSDDAVNSVYDWLVEMGISKSDIRSYENKGWLAVDLPVSYAESLLSTEYYEHEHNGALRIGCDEYKVPKHISQHIDLIMPGVKLSAPVVKKQMKRSLASLPNNNKNRDNWAPKKISPDQVGSSFWQLPPLTGSLPSNLQGCSTNFTVDCYRALYEIPSFSFPIPGYEPAVYESGDFYAQSDLDAYFAEYAPQIPKGTHPKLQSVDGGEAPVASNSPLNGGESNIDIDIVQTLVWPQTMILYQVDDFYYETQGTNAGFLNTLLDAVDGSYCHSTAFGITGDSPGIDASYPDSQPGGYEKSEMCGAYKPAKVISISYGESELDVPKNYMQRQCQEFLKLGLQGTTVLASSGDYGVGMGKGTNVCLNGTGQTNTIYNSGNPVSCPYITAVGATQLNKGTTILDAETAMQTPLGPGSELFASGGGFSNYFPVPDYQKSAVSSYFANHDPGHLYYVSNANATNIGENGGLYNRAGRGYPDISANGANFRAFTNSTDFHFFGTSLAAPLWNGIITLINQERGLLGKGTVGFINPFLYQHASLAIKDIVGGSNPNCGSSGFSAVPGWDPVTGLGTPKYPELLALWLTLP